MNYKLAIMSSVLLLNANLAFAQEEKKVVPVNVSNLSLKDNVNTVDSNKIPPRTEVYNNKDFINDKNTGKTRAEVKEELLRAQKAGELSNLKQFFNY